MWEALECRREGLLSPKLIVQVTSIAVSLVVVSWRTLQNPPTFTRSRWVPWWLCLWMKQRARVQNPIAGRQLWRATTLFYDLGRRQAELLATSFVNRKLHRDEGEPTVITGASPTPCACSFMSPCAYCITEEDVPIHCTDYVALGKAYPLTCWFSPISHLNVVIILVLVNDTI